jgi:Flp pilus assembly protein TadG
LPRQQTRDRAHGQALAEVALVLPLFFALLFGLIDLGRVIWAIDVVGGAAREGARYASVHAGSPGAGTGVATEDEIKAHALGFVVAGGLNTSASVCFSAVTIASQSAGCSGGFDVDMYKRGNLVTVRVESQVPIFLGAIFGRDAFDVSGESTVLINN